MTPKALQMNSYNTSRIWKFLFLGGAIVSAFLLFRCTYHGYSSSTRHGEAYVEVVLITFAAKNFFEIYRKYPPVPTWLDELSGSEKAIINTNRICFIDIGDDPWKHPYYYVYPGKRGTVDVFSAGHNGISYTEGNDPDDINNWDTTCAWTKHYKRSQFLHRCLWFGLPVVTLCVLLVFAGERAAGTEYQETIKGEK